MSTKRHAAARRRQAQSRKTSGIERSPGRSPRVTPPVEPRPSVSAPTPVLTPQPLLPPLLASGSFAARAGEQLDVGPNTLGEQENDNLGSDSHDLEDSATAPDESEEIASVPAEAAVHTGNADARFDVDSHKYQGYQTPLESAADRVAYIISPLVASFRAYTPAWRESFRRRERDWRQSYWYRELRLAPRFIAGLLFVLVASTFAVVVATKAATLSPSALITAGATPSLSGGIVLQQSPSGGTPTAPTSDYLIGVWTSNASPPTSGSVQVFVRLTHTSQAVSGIPVSISVALPGGAQSFGPIKTDSYGLATFTLVYAGTTTARPIYITATATVDGQKLTQQTYFVPQ